MPARTRPTRKAPLDQEGPLDPQKADLCIPIDRFLAHHRLARRTEAQEAACNSAKDFADTLNGWRDSALNIEIASIPTPVIKLEDGFGSGLERELYFRVQK